MLKINVNKESLSNKRSKMQEIYELDWSFVLEFLCGCGVKQIRKIFNGQRRDYYKVERTADMLISKGKENMPKRVEKFLETRRKRRHNLSQIKKINLN